MDRIVFVGGPGRSGTSVVAYSLGRHSDIVSPQDVELKFFFEMNGLFDMARTLTSDYSPNRAEAALWQFRQMTDNLIDGFPGQTGLVNYCSREAWQDVFGDFLQVLAPNGHAPQLDYPLFLEHSRIMIGRIADLFFRAKGRGSVFVEKTPHNLLGMSFLADLYPNAFFLHVMRDPRVIASSLIKMPWGPDNNAAAAEWVKSYCKSWVRAKKIAQEADLHLIEVKIEEISAKPIEHAEIILRSLGVSIDKDLFSPVGSDVPANSIISMSENDKKFFQDQLGDWAEYFGYNGSFNFY